MERCNNQATVFLPERTKLDSLSSGKTSANTRWSISLLDPILDRPFRWIELIGQPLGCTAQPFSLEEVNLKVQATTKDRTKGLVVPYVDARAIMDRLDEVLGPEGWSDRYEFLGASSERVSVKCSLTITGIAKEDAGEGDDFKAACSDALKRAAVKFGIGRYLL